MALTPRRTATTRMVLLVAVLMVAVVPGSAQAASAGSARGPGAHAAGSCEALVASTSGSTFHKVMTGLGCKLRPAIWGAQCVKGIGEAFVGPLRALGAIKDAKTAKGLYDMRRVPKKYKPFARLYNKIWLAPI